MTHQPLSKKARWRKPSNFLMIPVGGSSESCLEGGGSNLNNERTITMINTVEAEDWGFTGVATLDKDYRICEVEWLENGRPVKSFQVPADIKMSIKQSLKIKAEESYQGSLSQDPLSLSHDYKENN
jgi:hypothetical protein